MPLRSGQYAATPEKEHDWEVIAADWWNTSFRSVPWSSVSKPDPANKKWRRNRQNCSLFYNPHWKQSRREENRAADALNVELVGVRAAMESVIVYERDVGFHLDLNLSEGVDLSARADEKEVLEGRKRWEELLEELMNGPTFDSDESLESSFMGDDLHRSTSTLSSFDLTFSEGSIDSIGMPLTPRPKSSFNDVEIKEPSPEYLSQPLSPTRALNASASSFVPTFGSQLTDEPALKSPAASFATFTFPTLNAQTPPGIKIKKDDQGFFTEVHLDNPSMSAPGADLLPPFLQESSQRNRPRKSRTREIVDRLRSQPTPATKGSSAQLQQMSNVPSPAADESAVLTPRLSVSEDGGDRVSRLSSPSCEDDDGWIDISQPNVTSSDHKSKRARQLLLALTRRRTDSLTSENIKEMMLEGSPDSSGSHDISLSSSPSPSPPLVTPNDGWTESSTMPPPEPQKKAKKPPPPIVKESHQHTHSRKKSSNHTSHASTSSTTAHSHSHLQPQLHSHPHPHPQQFNASSSLYPLPQHPTATLYPQMVPPQTVPYFFPAYPGVAMPVPYTTFMQPHFHVGMPVHPVMTGGMQYAVPPTLMPGARVGASMTPSGANATNMSVPPAFRTKHTAAPLW